ncbi:hypothetical protein Syun_019539 [Stephania yunnanensis]|uniref:Protein kinase domain-containing protein n=1 Tax=Stephania yunnanensis TaxID=152371 RepID=A0AAP0IWB2_9MAGN
MAICRVGCSTGIDGVDLCKFGGSLMRNGVSLSGFTGSNQRFGRVQRSEGWRIKSSMGNVVSSVESSTGLDCVEEELGPVLKFKMSDFVICDRVSIGLGGRGDELVFEAMVKDPDSPLYNSRVVLRRYTSSQAKRRGKRAIEVLKRLARRKLLYLSYSMQVHGYVAPSTSSDQNNTFTLVHGYHGSYSLRHWLQLSDWLPILEGTLSLDEERVRRVGDDTVGGPAISRKLRLIRVLMRDLLIGVNYLHSHGLAHTELRLENLHISPLDRHIKVGILGNASDFYENTPNNGTQDSNVDRRNMMIAFDMRCVGFIMAKMVLRELMDPLIFTEFKSFLNKGNDPSCLREFLLPILSANSPSGNPGLQILDRNWGAGWNLLLLLLATRSYERISCLDALRHPFLCGPRWRVDPSIDMIRWGLGSTAIRITEEYIYGHQQRSRLAHFIELMEMLNPHPKPKNWLKFLPGRWRLVYCTGRHVGLTLRQPPTRVLIGDRCLILTVYFCTLLKIESMNFDILYIVYIREDYNIEKKNNLQLIKKSSSIKDIRANLRYFFKAKNIILILNYIYIDKFSIILNINSSPIFRHGKCHKNILHSLSIIIYRKSILNIYWIDVRTRYLLKKYINQSTSTQIMQLMVNIPNTKCFTRYDHCRVVLSGVTWGALMRTKSCYFKLHSE